MDFELSSKKWFSSSYFEYEPLMEIVNKIKSKLKQLKIDIVIDEKCKDVHFLIPKLMKTIDICKNEKYFIHKVDLLELPLKIEGINHPITKVPTVIFSFRENEIFKIEEKLNFYPLIEQELEWNLTMIK